LVECIHKFIPDQIQFTLKKKMVSENGRTSLRTIKRSGPGGSESLETSAQAYLDQLDKLVQSLNKSDLGSKEFETILHQLKGHSNLIHHRTSSQYWQHISEASKTGERMKALEELDSLQEIVEAIKKQIESLLLLEADFESQSQKRESFNYGSLSYTKESIKY
ncbi:MAG: hypothetical protein MI748_01935, partial [Opitutales bacterium]|nr:hypothetical protein [Opitutales bacterium]